MVVGRRRRAPERPGALRAALGLRAVVSNDALRGVAWSRRAPCAAMLTLCWRPSRAVPGPPQQLKAPKSPPAPPLSRLLRTHLRLQRPLAAAERRVGGLMAHEEYERFAGGCIRRPR